MVPRPGAGGLHGAGGQAAAGLGQARGERRGQVPGPPARPGHGAGTHEVASPFCISASKSSIRMFVITEKAPTRAFSWLKAATTAFTFKTLL